MKGILKLFVLTLVVCAKNQGYIGERTGLQKVATHASFVKPLRLVANEIRLAAKEIEYQGGGSEGRALE